MMVDDLESGPGSSSGGLRQKSDDHWSFATRLQVLVAIMVPLFGAISAWQANQASARLQSLQTELQQVRQETERRQKFAERIQSQLDSLTSGNPAKARIALASLYTLAKQEDEKSILFTIAIVSGNEPMRDTITDLVMEDTSASDDLKRRIKAKLEKIVTAASEDGRLSGSEVKAQKDVSAEKKVLQHLTQQQPTIAGWIYIGKIRKGSSQLEADRTIQGVSVPAVGASIKMATSVNLRSRAPSPRGLGAVNGILANGLWVRVEQLSQSDIDSRYKAVWAKVVTPE